MTLNELRKLKCTPCPKGTSPLSRDQARKRLASFPGWRLTGHARAISKKFLMKDFSAAIALMKAILPVAQAEDHHPDLHLTGYRKLQIVLSTHEVGGLSNNDFILAAKIEALPKSIKVADRGRPVSKRR